MTSSWITHPYPDFKVDWDFRAWLCTSQIKLSMRYLRKHNIRPADYHQYPLHFNGIPRYYTYSNWSYLLPLYMKILIRSTCNTCKTYNAPVSFSVITHGAILGGRMQWRNFSPRENMYFIWWQFGRYYNNTICWNVIEVQWLFWTVS